MGIPIKPEDTNDRVLKSTRILASIIAPILIAAFIMLYLFPKDTGTLFAWPIKPTMSAMMLGATYMGGAYFFTKVAMTKKWHTVSLGFIPVTAFAGILGIATLLHWDLFTSGHISFILWAFLYLTLPIAIPIFWLINQRVNQGAQGSAECLPQTFRWVYGILGSVLTLASVMFLITPEMMIPSWSWTLSPLTSRVLSAMFALPGLVGISAAIDGRWSAVKVIFQSQALSILLILLAMIRAKDEINWTIWGSWSFVSGLLLVLGLIGWAFYYTKILSWKQHRVEKENS